MQISTRSWDIRISKAFIHWYQKLKDNRTNNYFYKLNISQSRELVGILARTYGVVPPTVDINVKCLKKNNAVGMYWYLETPPHPAKMIYLYPRSHIKTVIHEFYHHLENVTRKYNSSDELKYAHMYADKMYDKLRRYIKPSPKKKI